MKIPRDMGADELIHLLKKHGYAVTRQTGSHIRLTAATRSGTHSITVLNHQPIKIGTLGNIVKDVCNHKEISVAELFFD